MEHEKDIKKSIDENILKEIELLSKQSNATSNYQLDLFKEFSIEEDVDIDPIIDFGSISDMANPEKSHKLYYGTRRLLIDYLPKGKENKKLRQYIYDEKNLFLKQGKEIGADGRQSYISNFLEDAFKVVSDWIIEGGSPYDLFIKFRDMNIKRGYRKDKV